MAESNINLVAVIGSGTMGSQIAMVAALAGYEVVLQDVKNGSLENAKEFLNEQMEKRIKKERYTRKEVEEAFNKLRFTTDINQLNHADIVIEAIIEKLEAKRELFKKLNKIVSKNTLLVTNSSTIVSSKIADVVDYARRVCNMHFFNPVLVMEMVEVVKGPHTSDATADKVMEFAKSLNKIPVLLKKEISGFIANRILGKYMDEAVYLLENDYATHEEIDLICKKALNHPVGPFELLDMVGIEVSYGARVQRFEESGDEIDRPSQLLKEKVEKGELGKKTGKGFYTYDN